ncbi:MAG: diguanylate cyclase [Anaerolineae bacterium]|nr:diguanylate cyclase [Anaerolineae bacterium]
MELRLYLQILLKRWWLIVPLTLISLTLAMFWSYSRPMIYQSTATYVTRLGEGLTSVGDTLYALDTFTGRQRLFVTYCEVMKSRSVVDRAMQIGNIDPNVIDWDLYSVNCNVLPESNVIMVIVRGPNASLVKRLADAIGVAGTARAGQLYSFVGLEELDPPEVVEAPGNRMQQGILGGMVGFALGVGLAFVLEYLRSPVERLEMASIRHPKLGIYNERYFQQRLMEEINRARARNRPLSLALMRLTPTEDFSLLPPEAEDMLLRAAALRLQDKIRVGDIVAYLGRHTFAILLPETPAHEAQRLIEMLHQDIRTHTFKVDAYIANFLVNSGIVESSGGLLDLQTMLTKANEALRMARQEGENSLHLIRTSAQPFALDAEVSMAEPSESGANVPFTSSELDRLLEESAGSTPPRTVDLRSESSEARNST